MPCSRGLGGYTLYGASDWQEHCWEAYKVESSWSKATAKPAAKFTLARHLAAAPCALRGRWGGPAPAAFLCQGPSVARPGLLTSSPIFAQHLPSHPTDFLCRPPAASMTSHLGAWTLQHVRHVRALPCRAAAPCRCRRVLHIWSLSGSSLADEGHWPPEVSVRSLEAQGRARPLAETLHSCRNFDSIRLDGWQGQRNLCAIVKLDVEFMVRHLLRTRRRPGRGTAWHE